MSILSTNLYLDELLKSSNSSDQDFAKTINEYSQSRDPELSQKIQPFPGWNALRIFEPVNNEEHDNPLNTAIAELIALRIKGGDLPDSKMINRFLDRATGRKHCERRLLNAAHEVGLSECTLALYVALIRGHELKFGWKEKSTNSGISNFSAHAKYFLDEPPKSIDDISPIESMIWNLNETELHELLKNHTKLKVGIYNNYTRRCFLPYLQGSLAKHRPDALVSYLQTSPSSIDNARSVAWKHILCGNPEFAKRCLEYIVSSKNPSERLETIVFLDTQTEGEFKDKALEITTDEYSFNTSTAIDYLTEADPVSMIRCFIKTLECTTDGDVFDRQDIRHKALQSAVSNWSDGGKELFLTIGTFPMNKNYSGYTIPLHANAIDAILTATQGPSENETHEWIIDLLKNLNNGKKPPIDVASAIWNLIAECRPVLFEKELWQLLQESSKILRERATSGLLKLDNENTIAKASTLLIAKKMDARLGATALLQALGGDAAIQALQSALETEKSDKVRTAMHAALEALGVASAQPDEDAPELTYAELLTSIEKQAKRIKLPKGDWLKLDQLPPLKTVDGEPLPELVLTFLIQKQAKHKTISPAGDILPLLQQIDRSQSTPFALELFRQWMASDQVAGDRWVLTFTGLLSDSSAIPVLVKTIPTWAENSRHKMAEYAAQAIALIPGDTALTVLDGLATRYRSKFKNIGAACRAALVAAAAERGVSVDELADLIVPHLEFNEEAQRTFSWDGGSVIAELGIDFKLTWMDANGDKPRKALPASAPAEVKSEVTVLKKLIREAVKGQTARLELNLVRQRRWPVTRWQELFENHPLLRGYASRLVWGVYNADGTLVETFRRYPNGLLANAAGSLVELEAGPQNIGMLHPLELDAEALAAWQEHLGRFKIKPPFPQLDRQVITLKELHGNRKSITVADGKEVSYGTFRSRCEKRGWARGSVVDAGFISSYYKDYPGAGIEVYLFLEEGYVGMDPMDTVKLGTAYFAKENSITRGSYTYDEPSNGDDPRVVAFAKVPPVVYSETMSDLYTIIGEAP